MARRAIGRVARRLGARAGDAHSKSLQNGGDGRERVSDRVRACVRAVPLCARALWEGAKVADSPG